MNRQTDRQTDRQTNRQTERETDRQTDRQNPIHHRYDVSCFVFMSTIRMVSVSLLG